MKKGEITAFLSLIFVLLLSFIGALTESAAIQISKNYSRENMDTAMYSVFGEYQREMLEDYEIFSLDGSYETGSYSEQNLLDRLIYYGASAMENEVEQIQLLSDNNGAPLREQIIYYMKDYYGITALEDLSGQRENWEEMEIQGEACEQERNQSQAILDSAQETSSSSQELTALADLERSGILELVLPDTLTLSAKAVSQDALPSARSLQSGRGTFEIGAEVDSVAADLYLVEYILRKFGNALEGKDGHGLSYEMEYLIGGKASDKENLETVCRRLLLLRMGTNYIYLQGDAGRREEAELLGLAIATLMLMPEAAEGIAQVLLLGWAYGESITDLRILFRNGKVPLVKTGENWHLPLYGLFTLASGNGGITGQENAEGLTYREYLRMMLYLKGKEKNTKGIMDLIEINLHTKGLTFFRVDACVTKLKIQSRAKVKQGFEYDFSTYFGYR
ncbi:MAG: DUF5702 domain-containing protein [Hespellia sp.]|nr:DUF5702 domain-containing protein [Hespellia sp.]